MCDFCDKYEKEKYFTSFQIKKAIKKGFISRRVTGDNIPLSSVRVERIQRVLNEREKNITEWREGVMRDVSGYEYAACSGCARSIQRYLDGDM